MAASLEPCSVQRQCVDCDLRELRCDKFAVVTNPCNIPEKHSLNCSSKYLTLDLRNLLLSRFCFNKEFKQATKISSTQCLLLNRRHLTWRGYTPNYKWRRGALAGFLKRKNNSFKWGTGLELNWQSILVR